MRDLQATADASALTTRISALIAAKRPTAARHLMAALRRLVPPSSELAQLAARIAVDEGKLDSALEELNEAVEHQPDDSGLRKFRADVRARMGDRTGALADAADAVILASRDPAAKALLGALLLENRRVAEAMICLEEAIAADTDNPYYRQCLAVAQETLGDVTSAMDTLGAAIARAPRRAELRNEAILLAIRHRHFERAYQLAEEARVFGAADACTFGLMGHALSSLGRHDEAAAAYESARKLGPDDPYVRHLVSASGFLPSADRAPLEYVRTVFDGCADEFECHLISLGYRVPGLIRSALLQHPMVAAGETLGPALDLGCGTGLIALALSDLPVGPLVGVDLSPRMLARASAKQLYAEVQTGELTAFLADDPREWRLIVAADVLVYFGALEQPLAAAFARLEPGGWLVFSVEELVEDQPGIHPRNRDWVLHRLGRYAHSLEYVTRTVQDTGFAVRTLERQVLRYEADAPVAGFLAVVERVDHVG